VVPPLSLAALLLAGGSAGAALAADGGATDAAAAALLADSPTDLVVAGMAGVVFVLLVLVTGGVRARGAAGGGGGSPEQQWPGGPMAQPTAGRCCHTLPIPVCRTAELHTVCSVSLSRPAAPDTRHTLLAVTPQVAYLTLKSWLDERQEKKDRETPVPK
jgi:hypothetical protein